MGSNSLLTVQTVFTPPAACATTDLLTKTASDPILWDNIIVPAAGITATSCYPSQFWSSALSSTAYGPFQQLVCPFDWNIFPINSTYIVCCPDGYGLFAPNLTNTQRPATSAWCSSTIGSGIWYDVISYDKTAVETTLYLTGTDWFGIAWATAFDGIKATTTLGPTPTQNPASTSATTTLIGNGGISVVSSISSATSTGGAARLRPIL